MIDSVITQQKVSHIKWRMTRVCNYKCSYCIHWKRALNDNIQEDERLCKAAIPGINNICNRLPGTVKIDMLGGEVTLMDLPSIINQLTSPKLKFINITTNLSRDIKYYQHLAEVCHEKEIVLSMTGSYHEEYTDTDEFFKKASIINKTGTLFKVEMVSTIENQDKVRHFIKLCEQHQLTYLVDRDVRKKDINLIVGSSEDKPLRYVVTRDDGTIEQYKARSEFVSGKDNTSDEWGACIPTTGMYCTKDCDYVYVGGNKVLGCDPRRPAGGCRNFMSLGYYKLRKEPQLCVNPKGCSLCGNMSVARDKQVLIDLLEAKKEAYDDSKR